MGLPMFREPEVIQTKAVVKADPSAPGRSAIRRQPTIRSHAEDRSHHISSRQRSQARNPTVDRRSLFEIIRRDRTNAATTSNSFSANIDQDIEADADHARTMASNRRRLESGRALLRDALSYERPGHRLRQVRESALRYEVPPPIPSPPEILLRRELDSASRGDRRSPLREDYIQEYLPTPPYGSGDQRSASPHHSPPRGTASLTPRFAPAFRFDSPSDTYFDEAHSRSYPRNPRLTRRRSPFPATIDTTDGLGDRLRSPSPSENQWETLLTTIPPDARLPSASSSFTSATASFPAHSFSLSASSSSTLPSTQPTPPAVCDEPPSPSSSGCSDTDYEDYAVLRARPELSPRAAMFDDERVRERPESRVTEHLWRARRRSDRDLELMQMHAIVERMERREEVPDEWWAAAGLTRNGRGERERERL